MSSQFVALPLATGGGGGAPTGPAGGDLGGTYPNPTVVSVADVTTGVLSIANGGTGSSTKNFVDLTTNQTVAGNKTFTGQTVLGSTTGINQFVGGIRYTTNTITANYTVDSTTTDYVIFCNAGAAINVTLPTPTNGRRLVIKDISGNATTNNITLVRNASEMIEGLAASFVMVTSYQVTILNADGTNWWMEQ